MDHRTKVCADKIRNLIVGYEANKTKGRKRKEDKIKWIDPMRKLSLSGEKKSESSKQCEKEEDENHIPAIFRGFEKWAFHKKEIKNRMLLQIFHGKNFPVLAYKENSVIFIAKHFSILGSL